MKAIFTRRRTRLMAVVCVWGALTALNILWMSRVYIPRLSVEEMARAPLALVVRAPGAIEAKASLTVKAPFEAPIESKRYVEGQRVRKGELLLVLGRDRIRGEYQNKRHALTNAESDYAQAQREVRLQSILFQRQAVAYSAVEEARRQVVRRRQDRDAAGEAFRAVEALWNAWQIKAPFDGTVVRDAIKDEKIAAANAELLTLSDITGFQMRAQVDEQDLRFLREGLRSDVRVTIYPDTVLKGTLAQIGTADPQQGGGIPVSVRLDDTSAVTLRPRLSAEMRIQAGLTEPVISVPVGAIDSSEGAPRVWVLSWDRRLVGRPVELGRSNPERVEVLKGLSTKEKVVTRASPGLASGMRVRVETIADHP